MGSPILYHYDPVFIDRFRGTEEQIARCSGPRSHEIILMQGEAAFGLEAAARPGSAGRRALNLVTGVFGKGLGTGSARWGPT